MKLGWQLTIIAAAVVCGLFFSRKPWEMFRDQQAKAKEAQLEMREAEQERERLLKEKMKYSSSVGREEAVRNKGWTKPGESLVDSQ
jgi:hypothetical protein